MYVRTRALGRRARRCSVLRSYSRARRVREGLSFRHRSPRTASVRVRTLAFDETIDRSAAKILAVTAGPTFTAGVVYFGAMDGKLCAVKAG